MVTWRLASPDRAARCSLVRAESSAKASARAGEVARRVLECFGAGAQRQVPHGSQQAVGTEHPHQPTAFDQGVPPATWTRASASSSASSGSGITQRRCSLVPTSVQYAPRPAPVLAAGWPAESRPPELAHRGGVLDISQPEVEAVVNGDRESLVLDQVLEPRAGAGRADEADDALLGLQRGSEHGTEVAGGVTEVVLDLEPEPDLAAGAHHRGRRHRQQRGEHHGLSLPLMVSGAVAAGTSSRIAITSHSEGIPSKGRPT